MEALPQALKEVWGEVRDQGEAVFHDRYLDTDDWRLWRAGLGCRLRRVGDRALLTVKSAAEIRRGWAARRECEEWIEDASPQLPGPMPGKEIAERFGPALGGRPLRVVVELVKRHRAYDVSGGGLKAKATADHVEVAGREFAEVEIELVDGDPKAFAERAEETRARLGLRSSDKDKYARALELAGIEPPPRPLGERAKKKR